METLLHKRTTNQPRSVHSGRGDKSIAHDGWEAKSRSPSPWPSLSQGEGSLCASRMWSDLERLVHSRFVVPEQLDCLMIEERQDLRQIYTRHLSDRVDPEKRVGQPRPRQTSGRAPLRRTLWIDQET